MLAIVKEEKAKVRHVVNLYSFYVKREHRRKGIGRSLVNRALRKYKKTPSISK
jgi:GNAT superfamily N-acetyltransferase